MRVEAIWRSQQGKRTKHNRDYCGAGLRPDAALFIVLDGSTPGPKGGELCREIAHGLIDWFIDDAADVTAEILTEKLHQIHGNLSQAFPTDSASYVIVHIVEEQPPLVLHAGDCLLGQYDGVRPIQWQTQPHTLANATEEMSITALAECAIRNRLTRSFRSKEFMPPEKTEIKLAASDVLIVATDGFWAELDAEQQFGFLAGDAIPAREGGDDRSVLKIQFFSEGQDSKFQGDINGLKNFYIRKV